jgi:hypothetical protein
MGEASEDAFQRDLMLGPEFEGAGDIAFADAAGGILDEAADVVPRRERDVRGGALGRYGSSLSNAKDEGGSGGAGTAPPDFFLDIGFAP